MTWVIILALIAVGLALAALLALAPLV